MAISAPIPIPTSIVDEEEQLRRAIMRSLEENYSPGSSLDDLSQSRERRQSSSSPLARVGLSPPVTSSNGRSSLAPYRRSKTVPNCASTVHSGSPSKPTLTPNFLRTRSVDFTPPRQTYSTDCCEVSEALMSENQKYIDNLLGTDSTVTSPLHSAVDRGHHDCLEELINGLPSFINRGNMKGVTPLFYASSKGKVQAARRLIVAGAEVDPTKLSHESPLQVAVENGHSDMALLLLKSGADPNRALNRGTTALHECVYRGYSEILKFLLNHGGNPNVRDSFGISPLFSSAACGRNECLEMLLRCGGDPNLCSTSKAASPLYEACKESNSDCVTTLLKFGADPHIPNCDGLYPMHMACYKGSIEIVEKLLPVTDKNLVENCGMSPVHSAAKEDETEILEMLIEHGYDVNIKMAKDKITYRDRRQTALFFAVDNDSEECTEVLLQAGANTELDYVKPLLVAVSHGQYTLVDLLLSYGADVNASFAKEGALYPAAAGFAMKDARMLRKILLCGCDVTKCFGCVMGEDNHSHYDERVQKQSFCHFLSQERNVAWSGWLARQLLFFVSNVNLCSRMRNILETTEEWEEIRETVDNPRSLTHLCRLTIRQLTSNKESHLYQLPLPKSLISFLNHDDL